MTPLYVPPEASRRSVHVFDMARTAWQATANPGLWLKPVRHDDAAGLFLGLIRFDAGTRSGLHQHQAVATSFVVDGGLTDYHGPVLLHQAGINFRGSTHDAMAYRDTMLVSRLEGPVTYPPDSEISGVHAGSRHAAIRNTAPDVPPEVNIDVDELPRHGSGVAGLARQTIFDYAGTGSEHRMVQWTIRPETSFSFTAGGVTEFWVRGGQLAVNESSVHADCFVVCEPGSRVQVRCPYGALVIAWAEAPEQDSDADLFGF